MKVLLPDSFSDDKSVVPLPLCCRYLCATLKDSVNCYTLFASVHGYRRHSAPYFLNYNEEGCIL